MARAPHPYQLYFQFVSMAQRTAFNTSRGTGAKSFHGQAHEIKTKVANYARLMINDFVIAATDREFEKVKKEIARTIETTVSEEVERMAKAISRGIVHPEESTGPRGVLGIGQLSKQARERGWSSFDQAETGIKWGKRSPRYMARKRKEGKPSSWFKYSGRLERWFKQKSGSPGYFLRSFGPISVKFEEMKSENQKPTTARNGGKSRRVGRLTVNYFRKITTAMMPGQANFSPVSNPGDNAGVAALLPDTVNRAKLLKEGFTQDRTYQRGGFGRTKRGSGRTVKGEGKHRHAIDPFVSFYMTRAIPNAIWRRTERITQPR